MSDSKNIKIIQTVASGGTAVLFKAVQTSLDRVVAVKRLHQHLTNDENFTRRFVLEAKAAASLDHENIVHVIDFGSEDGCYQMVMEFVEGESLSDILERWRPIKSDMALAIVHQICLGLEHAHSKGIVHRDIKPGNIMITTYGRVKITDFGLAKLTQAATSQTAANSILGTPLYMSPEQAFGESVDQRSDLFSLGTVLYELLSGKQPFASENYMGVIQNIIHKEIPTVSEINPDVPVEVEAIASKALAKDRENRFQTAREFRESIEDYLGVLRLNELSETLRVLLGKPTSTQVLQKTTAVDSGIRRKKRSPWGVPALLAFVLVAAGSVAAIFSPAVRDQLGIATERNESQAAAGVADPASYLSDFAAAIDQKPPEPIIRTVIDTIISHETTQETVYVAVKPEPAPEKTEEPEAPKEKPAPKPRLGYLSINARPGAEVYVDGVYKGDTPPPLSLKLTGGDHKVECRHPRYENYVENLKITTGELSRRDVTLKKLMGVISLATQEGAELYVDGVLVGSTPFKKPIELDAGPHMLTLKKEGFYTWNSNVTVEPKRVMPLKITLSPKY